MKRPTSAAIDAARIDALASALDHLDEAYREIRFADFNAGADELRFVIDKIRAEHRERHYQATRDDRPREDDDRPTPPPDDPPVDFDEIPPNLNERIGDTMELAIELDEDAVPSWDPFMLIAPVPALPVECLGSPRNHAAWIDPISYAHDGEPDTELVQVLVSKREADREGRFKLSGRVGRRVPYDAEMPAPGYWPTVRIVVHGTADDGAQRALPLIQAVTLGDWLRVPETDLMVLASARFRPDLVDCVELEIAVRATKDTYLHGIELKADANVETAWANPRPFLTSRWLVARHQGSADELHLFRAGVPIIRRGVIHPPELQDEAHELAQFAGYGRAVGANSFSDRQVFGEAKVPLPLFGDQVHRNGRTGYAAIDDKGRGRFESISRTVREGGSAYPFSVSCGPFHPMGPRGGGGTGGEMIDPFSGYQQTVNWRRHDFLAMEGTCERLPWDSGQERGEAPEGWRCSYEDDLRSFAHHDRPHGVRAFTHARSVAFTTGSKVAAGIIHLVAYRYMEELEAPTLHGQGHTFAHRDKAWLAASQALSYCLTPPGTPQRDAKRAWAEGFQDWAVAISMPSGVTMRSHSSNSHWNPPAWESEGGAIPDDKDAAKTFMAYLVAYGMLAVARSMLAPGSMLREIGLAAIWNLSGIRPRSSTPHYVVVADHGSTEPFARFDDDLPTVSGDPRHAQSCLALYFLETGNPEALHRGAAHVGVSRWHEIDNELGSKEGGWHSPCNQGAALFAIVQNPRRFAPVVRRGGLVR